MFGESHNFTVFENSEAVLLVPQLKKNDMLHWGREMPSLLSPSASVPSSFIPTARVRRHQHLSC